VYIQSTPKPFFQANSKFSQIQQNLAKPGQNQSKKKAWISLDSLVRIEPFQGVTPTPGAKKIFLPFLALQAALRQGALERRPGPMYHDF
jgi:hypothetical protein